MFSFTILNPAEGDDSCRASLLSFDNEIKILADPSWNGKNPDSVLYLEKYLKEIDLILLSHATAEFISGYVLLCVKFPYLMSNIAVYSTLPVNQLGRISTIEYYRSSGILGPLKDSILEADEVDEWFDKVKPLKYMQTLNLFDSKLVITPYNAGHTLGGTFWLLTRQLEKVIYAPAWNHSKDSFLNNATFLSSSTGNPSSQLLRPTALITNTDLGSTMSHKKRTEKFLQLVDATLANGGTVLLPTSLAGRFLELLHLVDQHLQSAPIPVYFLSYSGTRVLNYASNLLEWMSGQLIKEWEEASSSTNNSSNKNNFPFDPSKVDLLSDPNELIQLSGPKIVFCSGLDFKDGDVSFEVLSYLCQDEKTTIILTEKTHFGSDDTINSQLYREWYELTKQRNGGLVEDGTAVPLEKIINLQHWTKEEPLIGTELSDFQERISQQRKQRLLAKVRDRKNQNLLNADTLSDDDSSDEEENTTDEESEALKMTSTTIKSNSVVGNNTTAPVRVDDLSSHEAFISSHIKQTLQDNRPLDLKITYKLKPRHAMFPFMVVSHKPKVDDYGEMINIEDFQKNDDFGNKLIMESKKKFEQNERRKWGNTEHDKGRGKFKNDKNNSSSQNKLTPQEVLNNQLLQKNLDTLFNPKKRVPINVASSFASDPQELRIRCGLSFVDLSGLVDLRSLSLIVTSLKPYNLILLPDFSYSSKCAEELDGLKSVTQSFEQHQTLNNSDVPKEDASKFLSLSNVRSKFGNGVKRNNNLSVIAVKCNNPVKIGADNGDGVGLSNFEIKLDDEIVNTLKWQKVDNNYRVAKVYGELEISNPELQHKTPKIVSDYINSNSRFTLKHISDMAYSKQQSELLDKSETSASHLQSQNASKLAIGNIRLPELKKKLMNRNLTAEFKSEGTLVVNNTISIRKVAYGGSEGEDTGDIAIEGSVGALYYEVKDCIREMLAYI
ncbi:Piso0_000226 [Millerozyma farinosa CBS 7064]|uniref:Cleavage and polyadenylation specificity factor subunit 2 n=1 Tax=Pichia sorbitophila (strain ATCC MYA-4447 / BCRC 22081 / CBS 7064 / NBRC 10061 / NRRL Y-12695) TaxID=559304 RepID=G8YUV5_PICSO|nr:Piso0_000226 [Millerozyma farinosa CBS 7064]